MAKLNRVLSWGLVVVFVLSLGFIPGDTVQAVSTNIVISQVYGGAGCGTAGCSTYRNDYIELFNLGSSPQSLNGWSVQYASAAGTTWQVTALPNVTLNPGQYFLISEGTTSANGVNPLPTPDATGAINMSATAAKVALVNNTTALTCGATNDCMSNANIVDFIGYGTTASSYEGAGRAPAPSTSNADFRASNACLDSDSNSGNFTAAAASARNTSTALMPCLTINDVSHYEGNSGTTTYSYTVSLTIAAPAGGVTFNIATADNTATIADSDYVNRSLTGQSISAGGQTYTFDVTVNGDTIVEPDETFYVNVTSVTGSGITDGQALGTILDDDGDVAPTVSSTTPANGATDVPINSAITVNFSEAVNTSISWYTLICTSSGIHTGPVSSGPTSFTITPFSPFFYSENCTLTVVATYVTDQDTNDPPDNMTADYSTSFTTAANVCTLPYTAAYSIQGSGLTAAITGTVTTQGVVVGDYELPSGSNQIRGFFLQDEAGDGDPATSDGIFVYNGGTNSVSLGDIVRVTGTAADYQDQTQIGTVTSIVNCGTGTISPTNISLPVANADYLERYESMLVRVPQTLYVTEIYLLGRFGQVTLSGSGKLPEPTGVALPVAAPAVRAANNLNKIILDDADNLQNADPIVFGRGGLPLSASNTLRGGDTIDNLVGVLTYSWGGNSASPNAYRIRPINAMGGGVPNFVASNPRPVSAPAVGGTTRVVGMNLLNYFNTFDGLPDVVDNCTNGVGGAATDCRGADTSAEFDRQWPKTVAAMIAMDADVYGIVEMENDGYGASSAIQDLVTKLNAASAPGTFAFIDVDANTGQVNALGTDAIKVGLIYRPARVTPVGITAVLNSTAFVNGGDTSVRNRPSLLQAFEVNATGARFLIDVNHLKSKGSVCDDGVPTTDIQGGCNAVRVAAVNALTSWLASNPTGTGDPDIVIVGDLNAYAMEDPITTITNPVGAGYINMVNYFGGSDAYSYVYDGEWGYLDYALASPSLLAQTTDVEDFHINSDEPSVLDYNTDFKSAGQQVSLYASDMYRISDHDPVVVGLNLINKAPTVSDVTKSGTEDTDVTFVAGDFTARFSDPEGKSMAGIEITSLPAHGTLYFNTTPITVGMLPTAFIPANTPYLVYTPNANYNGPDSFGWNGSDGFFYADTGASVNITLAAANDAPYFTSTPVTSVMQDVLYTYNITTADPEGNPLTITAPTRPVWLITLVDHGDGTATLSGLPHGHDVGPNNVTLNVSDGTANVDQSFVINVGDTNDIPMPNPAFWSLPENSLNGTVVGTVTYDDPDVGQTHTFGIDFGNTGNAFAIDFNTGVITVNNATQLDYETLASYVLGVHVTDNGTPPFTGAGPIFINLTNVNEGATIGIAGAPTIPQDAPFIITLPAAAITVADVDSNPIQVTLTMTNGTLDLSGLTGLNFACGGCSGDGTGDAAMTFQGSVLNINSALNNSIFHPTAGYVGPAAVTVLVNDLGGNITGPASLVITVAATPHVVLGGNTNPADGALLIAGINKLFVQFNMDVLHGAPGNPNSGDNPNNYLLIQPGLNGVFNTIACGGTGGGLQPDDVPVLINSVSYDASTFTATLNVNNGLLLADGVYRLFICGTTSITDPTGTFELNGGAADTIINFTISRASGMPATGFAPGRITRLPEQPAEKAYASLGEIWLEIPRLGVKMPIVGVPFVSNSWDVSWLGSNAGWLQGTAYPTWNGNSALTGHVWDANNQPGPFANLTKLWWGDKVIVHINGVQYVYEVRSVQTVSPTDASILFQHEETPWLTLVTCRYYDAETGLYASRLIVRAALVEVK